MYTVFYFIEKGTQKSTVIGWHGYVIVVLPSTVKTCVYIRHRSDSFRYFLSLFGRASTLLEPGNADQRLVPA
jgi:hypothetical protein